MRRLGLAEMHADDREGELAERENKLSEIENLIRRAHSTRDREQLEAPGVVYQ